MVGSIWSSMPSSKCGVRLNSRLQLRISSICCFAASLPRDCFSGALIPGSMHRRLRQDFRKLEREERAWDEATLTLGEPSTHVVRK